MKFRLQLIVIKEPFPTHKEKTKKFYEMKCKESPSKWKDKTGS